MLLFQISKAAQKAGSPWFADFLLLTLPELSIRGAGEKDRSSGG